MSIRLALTGNLASLVLALPFIATACVEADDPTEPRLKELVQHISDSGQLVGFQVAVARDGKMIMSESFGHADLEHDIPVKHETRFAVGSVTKAVTSFALLKLSDLGRIDLDARVQDYVPECSG